MPNSRETKFPSAPLRERVKEKAQLYSIAERGRSSTGVTDLCKRLGISPRYLYRKTLTTYTVDNICCALGMHPSEVYPEWDTAS